MEEEQKSKKEIEKELREKQIEEMKILAEKLATEKEELKFLIDRREQQKAEDRVSGEAEAGTSSKPPETEDEKIKREANEFLKTTGMQI